MHPADEYAALKAQNASLNARADDLRSAFILGQAPAHSDHHQVVVRTQRRRVFLRERLPSYIVRHSGFWEYRHSDVVVERQRPSLSHAPPSPMHDSLFAQGAGQTLLDLIEECD